MTFVFTLVFQFHKGTIKTPHALRHTFATRYFNSIKVQLKPLPIEDEAKPLLNFNSIKVQLKRQNNVSLLIHIN